MNAQPSSFNVAGRIAFVTLATVRSRFGCAAETVLRRVDDATRPDHLRWVFNLSAAEGHRRELRFWVREIVAPESCGRLTLAQVVDLILGRRQNFRRGELEIEWVCHPSTITGLLRAKALSLEASTIPRSSLANLFMWPLDRRFYRMKATLPISRALPQGIFQPLTPAPHFSSAPRRPD